MWDVEHLFVVWDSPELSRTSAIFYSSLLNRPATLEQPEASLTDFQNGRFRLHIARPFINCFCRELLDGPKGLARV